METTSRRFTAMSVIRAMPDNARTSTDRRRVTAGRTAVRRVTPRDWLVLRDLRLRALRSDPLSFGSTYEREAAFSDGDWKQWAAEGALGDEMATLIADRQAADRDRRRLPRRGRADALPRDRDVGRP